MTTLAAVACQKCSNPIGLYVAMNNRVYLRIGDVILRDAWGWCVICLEPWQWHSSEQDLARLIHRAIVRAENILLPSE